MQLIIYFGFLYIKSYWETHVIDFEQSYYPREFIIYFVPAYIAIWLFSVYISGGYDKPVKLFRIAEVSGSEQLLFL
jgi:O-antigen biosynthesis protein